MMPGWLCRYLELARDWLGSCAEFFSRIGSIASEALALEKSTPVTHSRSLNEIQFLPAALEIMETPASPAGRAVTWTIMAFFAIALLWACVGKLDVVAVAQGKLLPTGRSKVIQPMELGVVRELRVTDGQSVKQGDVLIVLDQTVSQADRKRLESSLATAKAELARLGAALQSDPAAAFRPAADVDPALAETQRALLTSMVAEQRSKVSAIDSDIARRRAEQAAYQASIEKLERTTPLVRDRVQMREQLAEKGFSPRAMVLELRQQLIEQEQDLVVQRNRLQESIAGIRTLEQQRLQVDAEFRRNVLGQRAETEKRINEFTQELLKAKQKQGLQKLAAPIDGVVQQLAIHTIGGVVTPAQALMVVVPDDGGLEVEARVLNKDIGFVRAGQDAEIKLETFLFTRYGTIPGKITSVSRDAVQDDKAGPYYPVRVSIARTHIDIDGQAILLGAGMSATVEIKTDQRRLIEYLLSPVWRYKHEALRER